MTLTPELIDHAVQNFPKANIAESERVLANHLLYNDFARLYPNYPKIIFYIVLDELYGQCYLKDEKGNLGRKLIVVGKNPDSTS